MTRESFYPGLVAVIRHVICWCSAFWLFNMTEEGVIRGILLLPFLAAGIGSYLLSRAFLRRPRTVPALVALGAGETVVLSSVLLWKCSTLVGVWWNFGGLAAVGAVVTCGIFACTEPPAAAKSITAMEGTTGFFVVFLWIQTVSGMDAGYSAPLLGASLLSLTVVLYQRLSSVGGSIGGGGRRGLVSVAAVLAVIGAVLALFVAFGAVPLGDGVVTLISCVGYCLKLLLWLIGVFFQWLASLAPPPQGEMSPEPALGFTMPEELAERGEGNPLAVLVIGILGLCVLAAGLIALLYRLRKVRVGGGKTAYTSGTVHRRRLSLLGWFSQVLDALRRRLALTAVIWSMRGSPQEMYLFLVKAGRHLDCRRQPGETPCAFVRRAACMTAGSGEAALPAALEALAEALGACLYAQRPSHSLTAEQLRCIRRSFRRALRQKRRARLHAFLRTRLRRGAAQA